jgi:hypothetical protein
MWSRNSKRLGCISGRISPPRFTTRSTSFLFWDPQREQARSRDGRSLESAVGISRVPAFDVKLSARSPEIVAASGLGESQHMPVAAQWTKRSGEAS